MYHLRGFRARSRQTHIGGTTWRQARVSSPPRTRLDSKQTGWWVNRTHRKAWEALQYARAGAARTSLRDRAEPTTPGFAKMFFSPGCAIAGPQGTITGFVETGEQASLERNAQ